MTRCLWCPPLVWLLSDSEGVTQAITRDPETMHGLPVFRGTRVPVQTLFEYLERGEALEEARKLLLARAS